ncbi:hypothetical protein HMPREF1564_1185 [Providencia alcalifaciens R90-1475]|nr:hypothetical protein HMPREF1564_1185 [Providencia alcalifaciens R90-1475]
MVRITELLIKLVAAVVVYLWLRNKKPEHAIALAVSILDA